MKFWWANIALTKFWFFIIRFCAVRENPMVMLSWFNIWAKMVAVLVSNAVALQCTKTGAGGKIQKDKIEMIEFACSKKLWHCWCNQCPKLVFAFWLHQCQKTKKQKKETLLVGKWLSRAVAKLDGGDSAVLGIRHTSIHEHENLISPKSLDISDSAHAWAADLDRVLWISSKGCWECMLFQ